MKIRKKLPAVLLAAVMLLTVILPVSAAGEGESPYTPEEMDIRIASGAALLYDVSNDLTLYDQSADSRMYPAALVKTMTLLLAVEAIEREEISLSDTVTVTGQALATLPAGGNTLRIKEGDVISVQDLLYCASVGSANEACVLLAIAMDGSESSFVARMNRRAEELGCVCTHFTNSHGLHDANQYTSARDMMLIAREGLRHELFASLVAATQYTVQSEAYSGRRYLYTANHLLSGKVVPGFTYRYATGVRTGYTSEAGNCLIASATKSGRTLIAVILNARNGSYGQDTYMLSFKEATRLLEEGFSQYTVRTLVRSSELVEECPVELAKNNDYVILRPAETITIMVPTNIAPEDFERTVVLTDDVIRAPVEEGQVLGQLVISANDVVYAQVDLLALTSIEQAGLQGLVHQITSFFGRPLIRFLCLVVLIIALVVCVFGLRVERQRRRRRPRRRNNVSYMSDARAAAAARRR